MAVDNVRAAWKILLLPTEVTGNAESGLNNSFFSADKEFNRIQILT
jgi:hypothetical protein